MIKYNWGMLVGLVLLLFVNCSSSTDSDTDVPIVPTDRVIQFSGMDWIVRTTRDKKEGPGPNMFSDSEKNVWVDSQGKLHLKVRQESGNWYCSGVIARQSLGYGKYIFYVNSDVSKLDQNVVAGFFTYLNDEEEIDIEFSKWSIPSNQNAQFAVQPSEIVGNKKRFDIAPNSGPTTHYFDWQPDQLLFKSSYTDAKGADQTMHEWTYAGKHVPKAKTERLRMNLWMFRGQMPSDLKEQEIVIDSVRFIKHP